MALLITKTLGEDKSLLLTYFRERGIESLDTIRRSMGESNFKTLASGVNKAVADTRDKLIKTIVQMVYGKRFVEMKLTNASKSLRDLT